MGQNSIAKKSHKTGEAGREGNRALPQHFWTCENPRLSHNELRARQVELRARQEELRARQVEEMDTARDVQGSVCS